MRKFDSFVMLAGMRTGSNFLEANLNALAGVRCLGELFNPGFIGRRGCSGLAGMTLAMREADPAALWARVRGGTDDLVGYRHFRDHDPRMFAAVMADPRCGKIVLTRNPVESYVSLKIARHTGQWRLTRPSQLKTGKAVFVAAEFEAHLEAEQAFQVQILRDLQTSGQTAFYLDYEDIADLSVLNGLAAWLGVEARLAALDGSLTVQNPDPVEAKVTDPGAMRAALAGMDRFNLSRSPNFEPRRAPGIGGFVAARGAPVLFMPLKGGPVSRVLGWLDGFGAVERGFALRKLRRWKAGHPGNRCFTVLRHPLARAHRAFLALAEEGVSAELRRMLGSAYGVALPPEGGFAEVAQHRAAFLAFLRFLKRNLSGQTGLRGDAGWATQAALVQNFGTVFAPDALLREERLEAGLAWLCADLGLAMPPLPPPDARDDGLAAIWDAEVEAAAREAYARDYLAFGFGDWRAGQAA
ncbi:MAG: hypothetical protein RIT14_1960 [Pseudomonadota bacterium]